MTIKYLIVKQSDLYPAAHFRCALFFALLTIMTLFYLPLSWEDPFPVIAITTGAFLFGYILAHLRRFKRFFTFGHEMKEEVYQMGLESMAQHGLLDSKETLYLFISLMERRIECFVSEDLKEKVTSAKVKEILKEKKHLFKEKNLRAATNELVDEFERSFPLFKEVKIEESPKLPEQTTPPSYDKPELNLPEKQVVSPSVTETDQNNSEDLAGPDRPEPLSE